MPVASYRLRTIRSLSALSVVAFLGLTLNGCTTNSLGPDAIGKQPDLTNPPKLINDPEDPKHLAWDRPGAFGPVPTELQGAGEKVCGPLGKDIYAAGYNPKAIDVQGNPIKGGGFLCLLKETKPAKDAATK